MGLKYNQYANLAIQLTSIIYNLKGWFSRAILFLYPQAHLIFCCMRHFCDMAIYCFPTSHFWGELFTLVYTFMDDLLVFDATFMDELVSLSGRARSLFYKSNKIIFRLSSRNIRNKHEENTKETRNIYARLLIFGYNCGIITSR